MLISAEVSPSRRNAVDAEIQIRCDSMPGFRRKMFGAGAVVALICGASEHGGVL
jgi:hypothetical protein